MAAGVLLGTLVCLMLCGVAYWVVFRWRGTDQEAKVALAVMRERRRIAQELHDVVGHGLLVIAMHARQPGTRADPQVRKLLCEIDQTAQRTLREMRLMLGVLHRSAAGQAAERFGSDPTHSLLQSVTELVGGLPGSAPPATLEVSGTERRVPEQIRMAALRVVQEGLTNALKHGRGAPIRICLTFDRRLTVGISTGNPKSTHRVRAQQHPAGTGPSLSANPSVSATPSVSANPGVDELRRGSTGLGLAGLRARVAALGGRFESGPTVGGGFALRARLPLALDERNTSTSWPGVEVTWPSLDLIEVLPRQRRSSTGAAVARK